MAQALHQIQNELSVCPAHLQCSQHVVLKAAPRHMCRPTLELGWWKTHWLLQWDCMLYFTGPGKQVYFCWFHRLFHGLFRSCRSQSSTSCVFVIDTRIILNCVTSLKPDSGISWHSIHFRKILCDPQTRTLSHTPAEIPEYIITYWRTIYWVVRRRISLGCSIGGKFCERDGLRLHQGWRHRSSLLVTLGKTRDLFVDKWDLPRRPARYKPTPKMAKACQQKSANEKRISFSEVLAL